MTGMGDQSAVLMATLISASAALEDGKQERQVLSVEAAKMTNYPGSVLTGIQPL